MEVKKKRSQHTCGNGQVPVSVVSSWPIAVGAGRLVFVSFFLEIRRNNTQTAKVQNLWFRSGKSWKQVNEALTPGEISIQSLAQTVFCPQLGLSPGTQHVHLVSGSGHTGLLLLPFFRCLFCLSQSWNEELSFFCFQQAFCLSFHRNILGDHNVICKKPWGQAMCPCFLPMPTGFWKETRMPILFCSVLTWLLSQTFSYENLQMYSKVERTS